MLTKNLDCEQLLNDKSRAFYKSVNEDLFNMELSLKKKMDAGVVASEFSKYEALLKAVMVSRDVVAKLQD